MYYYSIDEEKLTWKKNTLPDLHNVNYVAIDTETRDPNLLTHGPGGFRNDGYLAGISLCTDTGIAGYIPINHYADFKNCYSIDQIKEWFNREINKKSRIKIGANILYDLEWLKVNNLRVDGNSFMDVQIMEPLIDELAKSYSLAKLSEKYLEKKFHKADDLLRQEVIKFIGHDKFKNPQSELWKLPSSKVATYAIMDAVATYKIAMSQLPIIRSQELELVADVERRLIPLLLLMRERGVKVDLIKAKESRQKLLEEKEKCEAEMEKLVGFRVGLKKSREIGKAYDALGIPYKKTPKSKDPQINTEFLKNQKDDYSKNLLRARQLETAVNNFIDKCVLEYSVDEIIHCQFNQLRSDKYGTVSGRFSSSNPNLQQIPGRDDSCADLIRSLFVPWNDEEWWQADFSQIEYRFIVHYAYVTNLIKADEARNAYVKNPKTDFHQFIADMCGIDRKPAKNINFGLAYGMGNTSLANRLGLTKDEASILFEKYHSNAPFIYKLTQNVGKKAARTGFIKTILGRRRRFNLFEPPRNYKNSKDFQQPLPYEEAMEIYGLPLERAKTYTALNGLIQGSAADLMKKAMVDTFEAGVYNILGIPSLTVHDELDGSKPKTKEANDALYETINIMENCLELTVPVKCDLAVGRDWWDLKEIDR